MYIKINEKDLELVLEALQCAMENAEDITEDLDCDEDYADELETACAAAERIYEDLTEQKKQNIESFNVVVKVEGGIVQAIWADGPVNSTVCDLDSPDFATPEEMDELAEKEGFLEGIRNNPAYGLVW